MIILYAVLIVSGLGIIIGMGLSVASYFFEVKKDEKEEAIRECLPGANCGACGYSGCDGYATAIFKGETDNISLCAPGGNEVAEKLANITGQKAENIAKTVAVVKCNGTCDKAQTKLEYTGIKSCKSANMMFGGQKTCMFGCLGFGDCVSVCDNDAISICDGIAKIDVTKCGSCTKCVKACPKGLIEMLPANKLQAIIMCENKEKGAAAMKNCTVSCIGCGKCAKTCEHGAITVENFLAKIDPEKCIGCGLCKEACPKKCIEITNLKD